MHKTDFEIVKELVYDPCEFQVHNFIKSNESEEYQACSFNLNDSSIVFRSAKITPKKIGQFVTIWKRNSEGITAPYHEEDNLDFIIINVRKEEYFGQFVFPKKTLIQKRIISTETKEGKRGMRVYPPWDIPDSKQALKTQAWQLNYFLMVDVKTNEFLKAKALYLS